MDKRQQSPGAAYRVSWYRVIYLTEPPADHYDFIANLRTGEEENRRPCGGKLKSSSIWSQESRRGKTMFWCSR